MITRKELEEIGRLKGLSLGNAEKDYLLDLMLFSISRNTKNELVFKGGTCLYKFYGLNRFSEDLDFSATAEIDLDKLLEKLITDLEKFGIRAKIHKKKEPYNSVLITMRIEGPLFMGKPISYAHVGIDVNKKSSVFLTPEILSYTPFYRDVPEIRVICMKPEEIFSEKIRAILTRQRARDLFDIHFLLRKGVSSDISLVKKKMDYYGEQFDVGKLIKKLGRFEGYWEKELLGLTSHLPPFKDAMKYVKKRIKELYGNGGEDEAKGKNKNVG